MSYTLQQVAQKTGKAYPVIKKHAQRGKLATTREGRNVLVTEEQLEAYLAADTLDEAADILRAPENVEKAFVEAGNVISRLPSGVLTAILEGTPSGKRSGGPEPFKRAIEGIPKRKAPPEPTDDDPHGGKPVGFAWRDSPRWKRTSESTWSLNGSSFTWNGMLWEGGGEAEGRIVDEGVSPANPYSSQRPLSPAKKAP